MYSLIIILFLILIILSKSKKIKRYNYYQNYYWDKLDLNDFMELSLIKFDF